MKEVHSPDADISKFGTSIRTNSSVLAKRLGDEIILVHLETNQIYELNCTAARWWELVAAGSNECQILRQLSEEFDICRQALRQEIEQLILTLNERRLVSVDAS